jgi:hypothetical protein
MSCAIQLYFSPAFAISAGLDNAAPVVDVRAIEFFLGALGIGDAYTFTAK